MQAARLLEQNVEGAGDRLTRRRQPVKHPVQQHNIAVWMSGIGLRWIVASYLGVFVALTGVMTLLVELLITDHERLQRPSPLRALNATWSPGDLLRVPGQSPGFYGIGGLYGLVAVLLPIALLGAFVFRLFWHDPIQWRSTYSDDTTRDDGSTFDFRFYNRSRAPLVNLNIVVHAQIQKNREPNLVVNMRLLVYSGDSKVDHTLWALAPPAVPYTVRVPYEQVLVQGAPALKFYTEDPSGAGPGRNQSEPIDPRRLRFLIIVTGTSPLTGVNFVSYRQYYQSDMRKGHWQEVDVQDQEFADLSAPIQTSEDGLVLTSTEGPASQPVTSGRRGAASPVPWRRGRAGIASREKPRKKKDWNGWQNFDRNCELYVFGYGSLVSLVSLEETLQRDLVPDRDGPFMATLRDYRRAWNVGSQQESDADRWFEKPDGTRQSGVAAWLGISSASGSTCVGAVVRVSSRELGRFGDREKSYSQKDVTHLVSWPERVNVDNCVVYTYVPLPDSETALMKGCETGEAFVSREYLDLVAQAFVDIESTRRRQHSEGSRDGGAKSAIELYRAENLEPPIYVRPTDLKPFPIPVLHLKRVKKLPD